MIDILGQMICVFAIFCILTTWFTTFGNEQLHPVSRVIIVILGIVAGYLIINDAVSIHNIALGVTDKMNNAGVSPTL